jgi:hypothetical protein
MKAHDAVAANAAWIAEQRDRQQIDRAIRQYFSDLDTGVGAVNSSAFARDGRLFLEGVQIRGPEAAPRGRIGAPKGMPPADRILGFTHCLHQCDIRLDGDRAFGEVYATAYVLIDVGDGPRMMVRGLRYLDRYVRAGDAWLIGERRHNVDWMFEAPASLALALPQRARFAAFLEAHGVEYARP